MRDEVELEYICDFGLFDSGFRKNPGYPKSEITNLKSQIRNQLASFYLYKT